MLKHLASWAMPIALVAGLAAAPAAADDVATLNREAQRLQGELAQLQLAQTTGQAGASYETRLAAFEQELRNLTGMIEQLGYQQNQLSQRLDRLQADYDYRLQTLEGGAPVGAAPSAAPTTAPASGGGSTVGTGSGSPQGDVKTLGTVSQDQVTTLQSGQASAGAPQPLGTVQPGATQSAGLPAGSPKEQYDYAFGLLRKADYAGAETALAQFIQTNPGDPLVANAKYWLGETYYVRGNYNAAASAFGVAYQDHPQGPKAVDSLLKLGLSLSLMGQGGDACAVFSELERRFPTAPANVLQRSAQERGRLGC